MELKRTCILSFYHDEAVYVCAVNRSEALLAAEMRGEVGIVLDHQVHIVVTLLV